VDQTGDCAGECEFGALGGGILNLGGTTLTNVNVDGNTLSTGTPGNTSMNTAEGGGIDTYDPMVITNSTVDSNTLTGAQDGSGECAVSGGAGILADTIGFVMSGTSVSKNTAVDAAGAGAVVWDPDISTETSPISDDSPAGHFPTGDALSGDTISGNASTVTFATTDFDPWYYGAAGGLLLETGNNHEDNYVVGDVQVTGTTISGNTAAGFAGGLWVTTDTTAQVTDSTISGNSSLNAGGAMINYTSRLALTNSTVADNSSTGDYVDHTSATPETDDAFFTGGILSAYDGALTLVYDTISANTSATGAGGISGITWGVLTSTGSIIAGNTGTSGEQDCNYDEPGQPTSGGWNLVGDTSCGFSQSTDLIGVAADLGSLGSNGGPTQTMVPNAGSPAIDAGGGPACPATDQRGVARPQGKACDIGAVEVIPSTPAPPAPAATPFGYVTAGSDGGVFSFAAPNFGSGAGTLLHSPVVGIAATAKGKGYRIATSNGGVEAFGNAGNDGSMAGLPLNAPIVGIAETPNGGGYWLVASDGGVFAFGNAGFYGSTGSIALNKPIVGIASTPDGLGYWLVASDGGVFSYGDANFYGSAASLTLKAPIVGIAGSAGGGYWLVASDGGVFSFGPAQFYGSEVNAPIPLHAPITGIASTPDGLGYWLGGQDGGVFAFGDAPFEGSLVSESVTATDIVGIASA
jgi:hypothetical protein